jgi:hypothetical protein
MCEKVSPATPMTLSGLHGLSLEAHLHISSLQSHLCQLDGHASEALNPRHEEDKVTADTFCADKDLIAS